MTVNKLILSLILGISFVIAFGQTTSTLSTYFDDADYDISQEDYSSALLKLLKIYRVDSMNANINYEIGICYLNSVFEKSKAVPHFERAIKNITPNYEVGSYEEKRAPYDAYSYLGDAYTINYDIKKAIDAYRKYSTYISPKEKALITKNERKILSCGYANILTHNPVSIEKQFLYNVNTPVSDYFPVLNKDQSQIYFTSEQLSGKPTDEKRIYKAMRDEGKWQTSINITDKISLSGNLSVVFLSQDGKTLFFVDDDESGKTLYESNYESRKWTVPRKMSKKINCGPSQTDACLSADGKTIYFSSNRKDGYGGFDIYQSQKKSGEWGDAANLGPVINSPYDDICPKLLDDNKTLFFCSMGHTSIGGFDVFYSKLNDQKIWGEAVNMGYPFNTTGDEGYYWPVKDGFSGYMSLSSEFGFGEKEIYFIKIIPPANELTTGNITKIEIPKDTTTSASIVAVADTTNKSNQAKNSTTTDNSNLAATNNSGDTTSDMTILIKVTKNPLESSYLKEIDGVKAYKGADEYIRYYYGQYKNYDEASKDFDKILKIGFYSAQLKNIKEDTLYNYAVTNFNFGADSADTNYDLTDNKDSKTIIIEPKINSKECFNKFPVLNVVNEKLIKSNKDLFVILIKESPKCIEVSGFSKLAYISEHLCMDKKYRYTYGIFENKDKAEKQLEVIKKLGFANATVINFIDFKKINFDTNIAQYLTTYNLNTEVEATNSAIQNALLPDSKEKKQIAENAKKAKEVELKNEKKPKNTVVKNEKSENKTHANSDQNSPLLNDITEKLINTSNDIWVVQIATLPKEGNINSFKNIAYTTEHDCKDGKYRYSTGAFESIDDARQSLSALKGNGYADAYIVNFKKARTGFYNDDIASHIKTYNLNVQLEQAKTEETKLYSVQVVSSIKPIEADYFKGLSEMKQKQTSNGYYKYFYGKYSGYKAAKEELEKAKNLGFKDAFVTAFTEGESIENASITREETDFNVANKTQADLPAEFLTIQVASSKKQSDLNYFKGLEVKETSGKNNFFIYTFGTFSSVADAKKELKRVKALGFKDAYINKASKYE